MLGVSRATTKRVLALDSFEDEETKTLRGRHRRVLYAIPGSIPMYLD